MASNVVAETRLELTKAVKSKSGAELTPAKWAAKAGFQGSAAGPLREHMARVSGNGCGRSGRYPPMTAEAMLDLLDLADQFKATEGAKQQAVAKRIGGKLRPASAAGARSAKKATTRKRSAKTAA